MSSPSDRLRRADPVLIEVLERSRELGFLGPGPVDAHVAHAQRFAEVLGGEEPERVVDLGSGGGIPGLVLARIWLTSTFLLLDGATRRCEFLDEAVERLDLGSRVSVLCERAELTGRRPEIRHQYSLVTARSFGPPAVVAECAAPLLAVGGQLVVSEPPGGEDRWPADGLAQLGMTAVAPSEPWGGGETSPVGEDAAISKARMQVLTQTTLVDDRYPRRVGIPTKRPLF